ncbi:hypothetical protein CBG02_08655, partial [Streptococcus pyogenes]
RNLFEGREVHLVGHDWGAVAGMAAAVTDPQAWTTLSLLAIPPFKSGKSLAIVAQAACTPQPTCLRCNQPRPQPGWWPNQFGRIDRCTATYAEHRSMSATYV